MTTITATSARGRFVWYDLMTSDPAAAMSFYSKVAGWGTQPWDGPTPYTMWTRGEAMLGGVMELSADAKAMSIPPNWLPSVCVPDVDATAKRATELGAQVHAGPMDIPNVGRYAVLADPQGAAIAVFAPDGDAPGHEGMGDVGEFSWHELATTDHDAAFRFYSELFGWESASAMDMGAPLGVYQIFARNGVTIGGMYNKPPEMPFPPNWLCYVRVADLDGALQRVQQLGGQVLNGPMEVPGGDRIAQCLDPQGAAFALHEVKGS